MSQRPLMQSFEGTVFLAAHQKWGNLQGSLCSHSQEIPCSTLPVCESHHKEKQVIPRLPLRSKFSAELPVHCLHHHNYGHCNWHKFTGLPGPNVDPGCRAVSRKFHTKLPVCPHSVDNTCQNARNYLVQQNGQKQEQFK